LLQIAVYYFAAWVRHLYREAAGKAGKGGLHTRFAPLYFPVFRMRFFFKERTAMRYALRTVGVYALCLFVFFVFCLSGYAKSDEAGTVAGQRPAPSPARMAHAPAKIALPASGQAAAAARRSLAKQAMPVPANGWVKVESGSRQAYVGIHGGTAPLSLMRSTDGLLIAFTGQTGNDFMQVLKGGNASRSTFANPEPQQGLISDAPSSPANPDSRMASRRSGSGKARRAHSGSAASAPKPAALADKSRGAAKPLAAPAAHNSAAAAPGAFRPARPQAGEQEVTKPAAPQAARSLPGKQDPPPGQSVSLVFASSKQASNISGSSNDYLPFGLTPAAAASQGAAPQASRPDFSRYKPLKLRSYQRILAHSGSM
jgi:hypothetical protein